MSGGYLLSKGGSAAYREDIVSAIERPTMRPVVVIDPEDREQAERLARAFYREVLGPAAGLGSDTLRAMTDALRSLIAPPKPPEPTGLGAVVEDNKGRRYLRTLASTIPWIDADDGDRSYDYADVPAVKVLSQGVTS